MINIRAICLSTSILFLLTACSTVSPSNSLRSATSCIGSILPTPPGLVVTTDTELLQQALGAPGEGKLCQGQVMIAEAPVLVYRVWDQAKPYSLYGSWWSFEKPLTQREQYRRDNAICPEWSALDIVSVCQIKIGSKLVIGTGQSADCQGDTDLPTSPVNQVYLPNHQQQNQIQVEQCSLGEPWPESAK